MHDEPQVKLPAARPVVASFDRRTEAPFVLTEAAFYLPTLAVSPVRKALRETSPPVSGGGPRSRPSYRRRDDAACNQLAADQYVVGLTVVAGVGQEFVEGYPRETGHDRLAKLEMVGCGAFAHHPADIQMAPGVAQRRKLGETALSLPAALSIVHAGVPILVAGGVQRHLPTAFGQEPPVPGVLQCGAQEIVQGVFFNRRFSALATVE